MGVFSKSIEGTEQENYQVFVEKTLNAMMFLQYENQLYSLTADKWWNVQGNHAEQKIREASNRMYQATEKLIEEFIDSFFYYSKEHNRHFPKGNLPTSTHKCLHAIYNCVLNLSKTSKEINRNYQTASQTKLLMLSDEVQQYLIKVTESKNEAEKELHRISRKLGISDKDALIMQEKASEMAESCDWYPHTKNV
ncbi:hypothetical protein ACFLYV_04930 [Chloroflexota bacterium]